MTILRKIVLTVPSFLLLILSLCLSPPLNASPKGAENTKLWKKAMKIHERAIVIDTHVDTPLPMFNRGFDIGKRSDKGEFDLIRMKEGGLDATFFAVFTSNSEDEKHPSKKALEIIDEIYRQVEKYPELATLAFSPSDIRRIHRAGRRAILIGMENGAPIEGSLRLLRDYYRLGVRYITLTHTKNNDLSDSSTAEEQKWNGLSDLGKEVVREMNRLGMIIDVSHLSDKATLDVLEISQAPIMASHSSVRALCNSPRNLSDELIKAIAGKGGVVQINFFGSYLSAEASALREKNAPSSSTVDILIDHIDHVVKLVGADHVGLGSDFDGAGNYPEGLKDVTGYPLITYHLLKRGYSKADIKKIMGENFLRVFAKVAKSKITFQKRAD